MSSGLRLPECSDNRLTVDETAPSVDITCDQISDQETVAWTLQKNGSVSIPLGACPPQGSCNQAHIYSLTRSSSESTITFTPDGNLRTYGSYDISCNIQNNASQIARCPLDVVCKCCFISIMTINVLVWEPATHCLYLWVWYRIRRKRYFWLWHYMSTWFRIRRVSFWHPCSLK